MIWLPISRPPEEEMDILIFVKAYDGMNTIQDISYIPCGDMSENVNKFRNLVSAIARRWGGDGICIIGWMPSKEIYSLPVGYDPDFGNDRLCLCGHPYYRHFDIYEDMYPIGCKYCHAYEDGVSHRKETKPPEGTDLTTWYWSANGSICTGFKLDEEAERK